MILINTYHPNRWRRLPVGLRPFVADVIRRVEAGKMKSEQVQFRALRIGDQFFEGHKEHGWKLFTKVSPSIASALRVTVSGRAHNVFVKFSPAHLVVLAAHLED